MERVDTKDFILGARRSEKAKVRSTVEEPSMLVGGDARRRESAVAQDVSLGWEPVSEAGNLRCGGRTGPGLAPG